ncbi:hypothetical protein H8356DRAFT_1657191 [Neocallimastix lanati (nom. inval.)]|nr:hypothetical protein H8356DRAFT_1657191 [Neocallimastix sp. JGI-2020a]
MITSSFGTFNNASSLYSSTFFPPLESLLFNFFLCTKKIAPMAITIKIDNITPTGKIKELTFSSSLISTLAIALLFGIFLLISDVLLSKLVSKLFVELEIDFTDSLLISLALYSTFSWLLVSLESS